MKEKRTDLYVCETCGNEMTIKKEDCTIDETPGHIMIFVNCKKCNGLYVALLNKEGDFNLAY